MKILIMGLGNIGFRYSLPAIKGDAIETHYSASIKSGLEVIFGYDVNSNFVRDFELLTKLPCSTSIKDVKSMQPDVVVVCTSTNSHLDVLKTLFAESIKCKYLILEKPVGRNFNECEQIFHLADQISERIYVNYSRQFSSGFKKFRLEKQKELGQPNKIIITYSKDLLGNGSHFLRIALDMISTKTSDFNIQFLPPPKSYLQPNFVFQTCGINVYVIHTGEEFRDFSVTYFYNNETIRIFDERIHYTHLGNEHVYPLNDGLLGLYQDIISSASSESTLRDEIVKAKMVSFIMDRATSQNGELDLCD